MARTAGPVLYSSGEESEHQIKSRGERLAVGDAPLYLLAETCLERDPRGDRAPQAGARDRRLHADDLLAQVPVGPRQHRPGARGGHATAVHGERAERADVSRRPHHQGRQPRRSQGARARRRHGAVFRGRAPSLPPRRPRGQEPVRRRERARRVRDDVGRPAAGAESVADVSCRAATNAPGSAVLCMVEGSRPMLVEVQALVSTSSYGTARRMASGIDQQRLSLLLAVLEKRAGLNLMGDDVFVNIAGGMSVDEPASDLGVLAAIASSVRNRAIPATTAMFGEVGPGGRSSRHRAGGPPHPRGGADGVPPLHHARGQHRSLRPRAGRRVRAGRRQDRGRGAG